MDPPTLDDTTLSTLALLETRLLRLEHLMYGQLSVTEPKVSAIRSLQDLEYRFAKLLQHVRAYSDLLKLYKSHPTLFQPPPPSQPPPELSPEEARSIVLSFASSYSTPSRPTPPNFTPYYSTLPYYKPSYTTPSFEAVVALLTDISNTPIPDAAQSANLASLLPRMKGIEVTQLAQAAEIAELRTRSERVVRRWYEKGVLAYSDFIAGVESQVEKVEQAVRRAEKARDEI
ncbi:hypothetical protein F5Y17DRAFT_249842 [Xylariaceae sp. FL0594]|nr:hypothetical protein F5Y17DRAFT_249842 [Xylariaceae sp. FL0594]